MTDPVRLNLGCGLQAPHGWTNIDRSPSITLDRVGALKRLVKMSKVLRPEQFVSWPKNIVQMDLTRSLPYEDQSVDSIYSSHMLEHLYFNDAEHLLSECFRVLRTGGVIRLALPDGLAMAARFVEADQQDARAAALGFARELNMGSLIRPTRKQAFVNRFSGSQHRWQPSIGLAISMLQSAGFADAEQEPFMQGSLPDLAAVEHRERSFFVEGIR